MTSVSEHRKIQIRIEVITEYNKLNSEHNQEADYVTAVSDNQEIQT